MCVHPSRLLVRLCLVTSIERCARRLRPRPFAPSHVHLAFRSLTLLPLPPAMAPIAWNAVRLLILCAVAAAQCTTCFDGEGNAVGTSSFPASSCGAVSVCGLPDGVYWLAPAGTQYQAQCTGGWALAMLIDGTQQTFGYSSAYWTDGNLLNPTAVEGGGVVEAKLAPFLDLPGDSIKVIMGTGVGGAGWTGSSGSPLIVTVGSFLSLRTLFSGGTLATTTPLNQWYAVVPGGAATEPYCNVQGVNVAVAGCCGFSSYGFVVQARLGLIMNDQYDCGSVDTSIFVGGYIANTYWPNQNPAALSAGNMNYASTLATKAAVYVGDLASPAPPVCSHSATQSLSASPSPQSTPTSTPNPSCLPSAYTPYPYTDLSGDVLAVTLGAPSEKDCQLACCGAEQCSGYSWAGMLPNLACFLFANVTGVTPNLLFNSGVFVLVTPPPTQSVMPSRSVPASVSVSPSVAGSYGPRRSPTSTAQKTPSTSESPFPSSVNSLNLTKIPPVPLPASWSVSASSFYNSAGVSEEDQSTAAMWGTAPTCPGVHHGYWTASPLLCGQMAYPSGAYAPASGCAFYSTILEDETSLAGEWVQFCAPVGETYVVGNTIHVSIGANGNRLPYSLAILGSLSGAAPWTLLSNNQGADLCHAASCTVVQLPVTGSNGSGYRCFRLIILAKCADGDLWPSLAEWQLAVMPPSSTPLTPSPTPYCPASIYRPLPRTDLVGTLMGNAWYPGTSIPSPSESSCRQACCDAPVCDAYTFSTGDLQQSFQQGLTQTAQCYLYTNVTALIPNSAFSSGALLSTYS